MRRLNYILKRLLQMLPVLLVVTIMTFLMIHLIPGDPARIMAGEKARPDAVEAMRVKLGLDKGYIQELESGTEEFIPPCEKLEI